MQPIVFAYWNSRNDAHPVPSTTTDTKSPDYNPNGGILPSAQNIVREIDCFGRMKEFGNTADPALAKALERITGVVQPSALALSASTVKNGTASLKPMISSDTNLRFVASRKTLTPYGTDVYITISSKIKKEPKGSFCYFELRLFIQILFEFNHFHCCNSSFNTFVS